MSKTKTAKPRADVASRSPSDQPKQDHDLGRTIRETIESVVIAFVLAFLFRTFEAEAFVIPTGSMAPTLQGRHKDLYCENCGYRVRTGASEEDKAVESASRSQTPRERQEAEARIHGSQVVSVTCPLCRYRMSVDPATVAGREYPSYNGDRIIVAKFPYDFVDPKRWDIVVFKYPNEAKINYIKRLVGLPRETVRIFHGDIYVKPDDAAEFTIEHKPPMKQRAMAQMVYDNNYTAPKMTEAGWPPRWQAWPAKEATEVGEWVASEDGKSFEIGKEKGSDVKWLRYQHFPPSSHDWKQISDDSLPSGAKPLPQLITDYYAYNAGIMRDLGRPVGGAPGAHWVGDLMVEATVDVRNDQGRLLLDLVEGGVHFRATIDVTNGETTLTIDGLPDFQPKANTAVRGPGSYDLIFANFDDELTLWINGSPVKFDSPTTYGPLENDVPQSTAEDAGDLAPVGVGAEGGLAAKVSDLVVKRDIYYIADKRGDRQGGAPYDYAPGSRIPFMSSDQLASFFSNPKAWRTPEHGGRTEFELRKEVMFPLAADQFFVLGDNSPASADSRLWDGQHYVDRKLMIGKALFIYWPHSFDRVPGTKIPFPFFPNFGDMGFVR